MNTQEYFHEMYEKLSKCVWLLDIHFVEKKGEVSITELVGYSVGDGYIMTCAHPGWSAYPNAIIARSMGTDSSEYNATVVGTKPNWDSVLLRVSDPIAEGTTQNVTFGTGVVEAGDTVLMIGHPTVFVRSFYIGYAAYPCIAMEEKCNAFYANTKETCFQYTEFSLPTFAESPDCRLLGHVFNQNHFVEESGGKKLIATGKRKKTKFTVPELPKLPKLPRQQERDSSMNKEQGEFFKGLHPFVPVVHMLPYCIQEGSSGSPIFNIRGELIGMCVYAHKHHGMYGIHVSALKTIFNKVMIEQEEGRT